MKQSLRILALGLAAGFLLVTKADAQFLQDLQNYRSPSQDGLNVFEAPKEAADEDMDHIFLRPGGDFAIQFQALEQENDLDNLVELAPNLTLPSANLNIDVQFTPGVRMHLRTYLSSKHHNEAWVKGGYFQIDDLNFIQDGFLSDVMQYTRVRVGMDEINYGDTHFRRSDNAGALFNPFVENYIMDSFTTEPFAEVTVMKDGFLGVAGVSNGRLNQTPTPGDDGVALFGKLGYDRQVSDDVRVRLTGSIYHSTKESTRDYLYNGDRAGSRYHKVLNTEEITNDFMPRFNPGFANLTAYMLNPFVRFAGLEFFGVAEMAIDGESDANYTQLGGELLYRFGNREQFYVGTRYNMVTGETAEGLEQDINRFNVGGGWFLTPNVLSKVEYVTSSYDGAGFTDHLAGAKYNGVVVEAVISF